MAEQFLVGFTVHGQPVSKKNSMQLAKIRGRVFPVPSASYRKWMKLAKGPAKDMAGMLEEPISAPVHLKVMAYCWSRRKIDLSNIYAAVEDMLQKYGIIEDDDQVQSHDGSRKILGVPKDEARVRIQIFRFEEEGS